MAALDNIASELLKSANEADLNYKKTRDQAQRDKAVRLRRIVENLRNLSSGTSTLDQVTTAGNTTANTINVGGITTDYVQLDTAATPTPVQGMMFWDSDRSTVDVQLDADVSAKIGQDNFWYVKNQSGATIPKGKAVMAVGTLGASGRILIDEMVANGTISSKFLLGITAEDIANGADGFVMNIGKLRQVNTTIWPDGTVLYCDPTTAGNLTSTKPSSPNLALPVAFVVHSAANGVLAIRVSILDENALNTPTLAQVTTAGNTTTNAITVGGLTANNKVYLGSNTPHSNDATNIVTVNGIMSLSNGYIRIDGQNRVQMSTSTWIWDTAILPTAKGFQGYSILDFTLRTGSTSYNLDLGLAGQTNLRVANTTGNILINTTTDAGYKLDVNGTARIQSDTTISTNLSVGLSLAFGRFNVRGADNLSSSRAITVQNQSQTLIFDIYNNGRILLNPQGSGNIIVGNGTEVNAKFQVFGSITAASALARGVFFANTLVAAANNDVLVGLDINPTFTNGAFTGVTNLGLRVQSRVLFNTNTASTNSILKLTDNTNGTAWLGFSSTTATGFFIGGNGGMTLGKITADNSNPSAVHSQIVLNQIGNPGIQLSTNVANTGIVFSDGVNATIRMNFPSTGEAAITTISAHNLSIGVAASTGSLSSTTMKFFQSTGNVTINSTTDAGYKLDVNGSVRAQGGVYVSEGQRIEWAASREYLIGNGGRATMTLNQGGNALAYSLSIVASGFDQTLGTGGVLSYAPTINPNSGTAVFNLTNIAPTINQTGGANGITRGLYINPTITAAADFRAIETTVGNVLLCTTSGNVGIGTSNPLYKLHVTDSAGDIVYILASTGQSAIIGATGSGTNRMYIGYSPGAENISITSSGVVRLNSITSGNVLIGTTTDAGYKLDVNGTARVQGATTINNRYLYHQGDSAIQYFMTSNAWSGTNTIFFGDDSSSTIGSISYNHQFDSLSFNVNGSNALFINSSRNVGIGTTTPTDKFHIVDNTNGNKFARISAGGTDASAAWVAQNDQVDNVVYRVFGSAVTGTQMGISLARSASLLANLGGSGKFLIGTFSSTDFVMGTGNQERIRLVDSTGNFLVGTTTDNGNKLEVSGTINATAYKINNVIGYTGILNIPTNPPGMQNVDIQSGIVVNIF